MQARYCPRCCAFCCARNNNLHCLAPSHIPLRSLTCSPDLLDQISHLLILLHLLPLIHESHAPAIVLAVHALAVARAKHPREEALAVFFQAEGFPAVAPGGRGHARPLLGLGDLVGEGVEVPGQGGLYGRHSVGLECAQVVALDAAAGPWRAVNVSGKALRELCVRRAASEKRAANPGSSLG